ncbi:uncharacterized protein J7T55_003759 [Diaporthe amygdali]|uniref:uncharacterized protein n=1 Tax=Phomopsis amygdali TaxID=1214568 RepID=UPI0022FEA2DC|nr:uncharacterized protein J7T55_003759 [Diaporthe amygdali]KAJ0117345.1 uncharacterized protein J7T55_003759 [Diaporthe amygdali]
MLTLLHQEIPSDNSTLEVLVILFPGFNTLDMNGPFDVLTKFGTNTSFNLQVASESTDRCGITKSTEGVKVQHDIRLDDALIASLDRYDVLIVPGGSPEAVSEKAKELDSAFMQLITAFSKLPPRSTHHPRVLLSICTGALFLGTLGIFNGKFCTTHWFAYDDLKERVKSAASASGGQPGRVIKARFVDSGLNDSKVRIISSGGISCGIDASLYLVKFLLGEKEAISTAEILDYAYRKTEGVVIDDE